jgi:P4 family phage/plasmid primase-like protien
MSAELCQFLHQYKNSEKGQEFTHTSIGKPIGSYNVPLEEKEHLLDLVHDSVFKQKIPVYLTEKPEKHTIFKADLDFKFNLDGFKERKYTLDHIRGMVELYHKGIRNFLDVTDEQLKAFVFERDAPYSDKGNGKDGIHLMYPDIICDTDIQHLVREYVINLSQPVLSTIGCKNSIEDIIDKAVIDHNNWLLYGCCKPTPGRPYKLTHIYDSQFNDLNIKKYDDRTLIRLLSIRDHDKALSIPIKNDHKYLLDKKKAPVKTKKIVKITKLTQQISNHLHDDINLEDVRRLVGLLDSERAENYKSWIDVGLCLHNIDISLLDSWIEFSRKSPKFKEGECDDVWANMESRGDGLGLGSLHRWARLDDKKGYETYTRNSIAKDILKSQSQTTQDVAQVVYNMYKYQYVCTSLKHNNWYEFRNHRWFPIDSGVSLKKKIGNEVVNEYLRLIGYYGQVAYEQIDEQKDQYILKGKNLTDVTYKLRDYTFKEKILKECQTMFHDSQFMINLDSNVDLIGFENGVYDLRTGEFRDGRPEDYISLSTGNDFIEFETSDEQIVAVYAFMNQVFPDPEVRDYVFILLSSFLEGRNPNEKFHIWTGVGGNGKSKLLELFELAFGRYTAKIPVTVLTQKNRSSSSAANPEVSRLKGIRTVSTQEPEENERFNTGIVKDWTGGDKITCRPLYGEQFDFKPQFKMVFCCNHLPSMPPDDEGIWRRISVIDFKSRFVDNPDPSNPREFKKDVHLTEKLYAWKEAFMYILLEHYKDYKKRGLVEPLSVKESTREYQQTNDVFSDFVSECILKDEHSVTRLEDTYNIFKDWWKENYSSKIPSRRDMKSCLEKKLGKYLSSSRGGWRGFKLVAPKSRGSADNDTQQETVLASGVISDGLKTVQ